MTTPTEVLARYCGSRAMNAPTSNAVGALTALRQAGYEVVVMSRLAELVQAEATIVRVRARHAPVGEVEDCTDGDTTFGCRHPQDYHVFQTCRTCETEHPCAEWQALDGDGQ